ncbi:DUF4296 domain-containing protein [Thermoflexibacter ruber]|uniref:DUF4296 domain-containing protein n=1 Tax=Thermoflexibacter ruber TaxID=1003 RepID=A0A1I2IW52_9BACT|nr:DUF4296 domain-containing protein [Thermoflexibacter ruber]SFF44936.1 protein of unknown function [Thermoflexibacter ruber]
MLVYRTIAIFLFSLAGILYACGSSQETETPPPAHLISREKMIQLLTEIHMAEAGVSMMAIDHQRATALYKTYHAEILKKHGIDTLAYRQSYDYYMQKPLEMEYILTMVEDSLVKVQTVEKMKERTNNQPINQ